MTHTHDPTLSSVTLVLFDLDGAIRRTQPSVHEALAIYAAESGISFDEARRRSVMRWHYDFWANSSEPLTESLTEQTEPFWRDYVRRYLGAMGMPGREAESPAIHIAHRLMTDYRPETFLAEGAKELLWLMRTRRYTLGLVSNATMPLTGAAIELGVIEHFNFTLSAGQVTGRKPDPTFFHHAMALGGVTEPGKVLSIGANYHADVVGARAVGMQAILLDEHDLFPEAAEEITVVRQLAGLRRIFLAGGG